jgi:hypothetical protein
MFDEELPVVSPLVPLTTTTKKRAGRPIKSESELKSPRREDITTAWKRNFESLPEDEQQRLTHEANVYEELSFFMRDIVFGVRNDRIAGHADLALGMCYPAHTAALVFEHIASFPTVNSFSPDASSAKAFVKLEGDSWDDSQYFLYGRRTRLWSPIVLEFMEVVSDYIAQHPTDEDVVEYPEIPPLVNAYLDEHLPEWKKQIRAAKKVQDELVENFRLHPPEKKRKIKANAAVQLDEQNISTQERQRDEEMNTTKKFLNNIADAEEKSWRRGGV